MQIVPTRVNFTSIRQKSYSHSILSEHVINTPKIVRFVYQPQQSNPQPTVLPTSNIAQLPQYSKDDSFYTKNSKADRVARRSVCAEKEYTFGHLEGQGSSNKFSLVSKQFRNHNFNKLKGDIQSQSAPQNRKTSAQPVSIEYANNLQQVNRSLPVNHISFDVPTCEFFVCLPQPTQPNDPRNIQKHKREKIFYNSSPYAVLNDSQEFTNEEKTNRKRRTHSEDTNPMFTEHKRVERAVRQSHEQVQYEEIPACVLQGWQKLPVSGVDEGMGWTQYLLR